MLANAKNKEIKNNIDTDVRLSEIFLRRRGALCIHNSKSEKPDPEELAKFLGSLSDLGYYIDVMDRTMYEKVFKISNNDIKCFLKAAQKINNFDEETSPLYGGFPESVRRTPSVILFLDALVYAASGFSKDLNFDRGYTRIIEEYESNIKLKKLNIMDEKEVAEVFENVVYKKTAPSKHDMEDIDFLIDYFFERKSLNHIDVGAIPFREIKIKVLNDLYQKGVLEEVLKNNTKLLTTTDILRFLKYTETGSTALTKRFPLPSKNKLWNMSEVIAQLLYNSNANKGHYEDIKRYKEEWKHIFRNMKPNVKYPEDLTGMSFIGEITPLIKDIEDHLYRNGGKRINTWLGKEESLYLELLKRNKDDEPLKDLSREYINFVSQRPGEYIRAIDKLLMIKGVDLDLLKEKLEEAVLNTDFRLGAQLYNFLNRRDIVRLSKFKENSRLLAIKDEYPEEVNIEEIKTLIKNSLVKKVENNIKNDNIKITYDEDLFKNIAISTSDRNSSKNINGLTAGSRVKLEDTDYIRLFTKWIGFPDDDYGSDIDLAAIAIGDVTAPLDYIAEHKKEFPKPVACAYYNLGVDDAMTHSGDVRSKNGEEYIDIDIKRLKEMGFSGIIVRNTNYSGDKLPEIKTGIIKLKKDNAQKGSIFKDKEVMLSTTVDLSFAPTIVNFYIDMNEMELYWIDQPSVEGMYSSFDSKPINQLKNVAMIKQEISEKLMLNDIIAPLIDRNVLTVVTEEDIKEMADEEKAEVLVLAETNGENYAVYADRVSMLLG